MDCSTPAVVSSGRSHCSPLPEDQLGDGDGGRPPARERGEHLVGRLHHAAPLGQALVQDESSPFFTTPHFDGHPSVLLRAARVGELSRTELEEVVQEAWLSRASARRAATWLSERSR